MRLGERLDLDRLSGSIRTYLGGDVGLIYAPRRRDTEFEIDFIHGSGLPRERIKGVIQAVLHNTRVEASPGDDPRGRELLATAYDPLRPSPWQRNRALSLEDIQRRGTVNRPVFARFVREETGDHEALLRMLVCEGSSLLAWVGCHRSRDAPFGRHEAKLLQSLAPALQQRFAFEARLRRAGIAGAALETALEVFDGPALVVDRAGVPVFANRDAAGLLDSQPRDTRERIHAAQAGCETHYRRFSVGGPGVADHCLLLARARDDDAAARIANASREWNVTPRERDVLTFVVRGLTNAAIGRELGCAERTVEVHMTHLMTKARVGSRAELIARFWALR